jgi:hypothetical protein
MVCGVTNTHFGCKPISLKPILMRTYLLFFTLEGNERPPFSSFLVFTIIARGLIIPAVYISEQDDKGYTLYSVRSIYKMFPCTKTILDLFYKLNF